VPGLRVGSGVVRSRGVSSRTAFVTGATGFLGLNVVDALLADGWRVVALHRDGSKVSRLQDRRERGVSLAPGTLEDRESLERAIPEGCDAVFHVAGNVSMWSERDAEQTRTNVVGTTNVAASALRKGARRFVHTSTVAVWGRQPHVPFDETAEKNGATSRMNYARSKLRGEDEIRAAIARGLDAVIMNPCHIVGRYDVNGWSKMIGLVAQGKLPAIPPGRGSFCDAGAVARAHVAAVTRGRTGENYLLGGPEATYAEVVSAIGELTGKKAPTRVVPRWVLGTLASVGQVTSRVTRSEPAVTPEMVEGLVHEEVVDSSKAVRELGYETVSLRAMLEHALAWQIAEGIVAPPAAH
jgi:dihydroflavonol-4-reductase